MNTPQGAAGSPPAPGADREEPELVNEEDIPADDPSPRSTDDERQPSQGPSGA